MRTITLWLALTLGVADAAEIPVRKLDARQPVVVSIGTKQATILAFPRQVNGLLGYGLSNGTEPGSYHYAHPKDSRILSLRCVDPGKEANIGVVLGRDLFLLHLKPNEKAPPAIRFVEGKRQGQLKAHKISKSAIDAKRLDYSTDKLLNLLKLARNERVFSAYLPDLYKDAESRKAELTYDDDHTATVIRQLYRFPKEDAVVLLGEIHNRLDYPIRIDPASSEVRVGQRVYPVALVDAPEMVPASGKVAAHVIVKGDTEGNRANLSIKNEFRLVLSDYCRYEEPDPEWGGYIDMIRVCLRSRRPALWSCDQRKEGRSDEPRDGLLQNAHGRCRVVSDRDVRGVLLHPRILRAERPSREAGGSRGREIAWPDVARGE